MYKLQFHWCPHGTTGSSYQHSNKNDSAVQGYFDFSVNPVDLSIKNITIELSWNNWHGNKTTATLRPIATTSYDDIPMKFMLNGKHNALVLIRLDPVPAPIFEATVAPAISASSTGSAEEKKDEGTNTDGTEASSSSKRQRPA